MRLIGNEAVFLALTTFFGTTVVVSLSGWLAIGRHMVTRDEFEEVFVMKDEFIQRLTRVETKLDMIIKKNNYLGSSEKVIAIYKGFGI